MAERTPTDLERRLHELYRAAKVVRNRVGDTWCEECGRRVLRRKYLGQRYDSIERHAPGCLAAPDALTKGDDG